MIGAGRGVHTGGDREPASQSKAANRLNQAVGEGSPAVEHRQLAPTAHNKMLHHTLTSPVTRKFPSTPPPGPSAPLWRRATRVGMGDGDTRPRPGRQVQNTLACCGKRRAGEREAGWRRLIGEGQLSWHAGRCCARGAARFRRRGLGSWTAQIGRLPACLPPKLGPWARKRAGRHARPAQRGYGLKTTDNC